MAHQTLIKRAHARNSLIAGKGRDRWLGSRWAFLVTALILFAIFGATFLIHPDRPAAADDPAYYTWRAEALLEDPPGTMLGITGPFDMYSSGYRVTTPVIGALLRRLGDVGRLTPTIILSVGLRVLIPMLLAGFAYRSRKDPLIWHAVALGSASLLVTPPFAGYIDNMMTLLFLAASLYLIEPSRTRWAPRIAFFGLLLASGMTHPTTLAIFCFVIAMMAAIRWMLRGFDLRRALRDDGAVVVTAFAAAIATYATWKVGIWGPSASLSEAALPPPAGADFFKTRLGGWIRAMRPPFNAPLFLVGLGGLLAAGRRAAEDELALVGVVWLAPLAGVLGVFAGLTYPYYRFFNTTLAWVLLVGVGAFFVARFCLDVARGGGVRTVALVGILVVAFVVGGNFKANLEETHWNDPSDGWVKPDQRADLDALAAYLSTTGETDHPIVFVADDEAPEDVRIYGFAKLVGNVSRYAVPAELQDRTSYYLGSLQDFLGGRPTERDDYYRDLSAASLQDTQRVTAGADPLVVVAASFNKTGTNAPVFEDAEVDAPPTAGADVVFLSDGRVYGPDGSPVTVPTPANRVEPGPVADLLRALLAGIALLIPGLLLTRALLPRATAAESWGLVPVLGLCLASLVTIAQLAITRSPLSAANAWIALAIAVVVSGAAALASGGFTTSRRESYS